LFRLFQVEHEPSKWRLFIDSSTKSLKGVLLYNGKEYPSVPVYFSSSEKETDDVIEDLLNRINYSKFEWQFCGDLKMIAMTLGIQGGNSNHPCFLCNWKKPGRNEFWPTYKGEERSGWNRGDFNVKHDSLVPRNKVLLPPLHIKLGIMTQLAKKFVLNPVLLTHLKKLFPRLSDSKITNGIFCGPDIRKMMNCKKFADLMNPMERAAWDAFIDCIHNFFGNNKSFDYKDKIKTLLSAMKTLECRMTVKLHFIDAHIDYFPENVGQMGEEQGERFHQEISSLEKRYNNRFGSNILADYCWSLVRESNLPTNQHYRHFKVVYHYNQS
jgi:hypothetical protein